MRERNVDIRHRLKTLTANARENDKLYERTQALVLKLLEANSVGELYRNFMHCMQSRFDVEFANMILFGHEREESDYEVDSLENAQSRIGALLAGQKPVSGALREEEFNYLFGQSGNSTGSCQGGSGAIVPLNDGAPLGLIAVGSSDASRYTSGMGVLFLSHVADVILRLLPRLSRSGD